MNVVKVMHVANPFAKGFYHVRDVGFIHFSTTAELLKESFISGVLEQDINILRVIKESVEGDKISASSAHFVVDFDFLGHLMFYFFVLDGLLADGLHCADHSSYLMPKFHINATS